MIQSMTAFARKTAKGKWGTATWEIRSVNHRYLDCNLRLPEPLRQIEPELREIVRNKLGRGKVDCFLNYQPGTAANLDISLNTGLIKQLVAATDKVNKIFNNRSPNVNPMQILSWRDVLQINETDVAQTKNKVCQLFSQTLDELIKVRKTEGSALKKLIQQRLTTIKSESNKIKKQLPKILREQRQKLLDRLAPVKNELDNNRLEQELLYFAQKIDIAEEIDRLQLHLDEVARVLQTNKANGKRLDFLMQELNREANTMASKSTCKTVTHAAVEMKVLIEEMREQIQNIE